MRHCTWARGETVMQPHGTDPWSITDVNTADDPRNSRKQAQRRERRWGRAIAIIAR